MSSALAAMLKMPFPQRSARGALPVKKKIANQFPFKSAPDKNQGLINAVNAFIGSLERRMEMNFRRDWRFVWAINSGEIFQLPASRFGIESLGVAAFTLRQGSVDKDFKKLASFEERAGMIALSPEWTDK
jgi:hypothetical protein